MSITFFVLCFFSLLVAVGCGTVEERNGWLVASGLYGIAGMVAWA